MNWASGFGFRAPAKTLKQTRFELRQDLVIPNRAEGPVRKLLSGPPHRPKPDSQSRPYRNSSIAASSASLPGRVIDSGSVASG
jgi:hypothetical protein